MFFYANELETGFGRVSNKEHSCRYGGQDKLVMREVVLFQPHWLGLSEVHLAFWGKAGNGLECITSLEGDRRS